MKYNFNSELEPSLKVYAHLLSNSEIKLAQAQEVICDRDSWVLLWNELTRSVEDRDQYLGIATSRFLLSITLERLPVLFLTPIPLSSFELDLASIGLIVENFEMDLPINIRKKPVKFFYKYPQFGWRNEKIREARDRNKPWLELEFNSKCDIKRFINFYGVVSNRDWRVIISIWYWSFPILTGLIRSLYFDFCYRWKFNKGYR